MVELNAAATMISNDAISDRNVVTFENSNALLGGFAVTNDVKIFDDDMATPDVQMTEDSWPLTF
jgi:hypothetical protein